MNCRETADESVKCSKGVQKTFSEESTAGNMSYLTQIFSQRE